MAKTLTVRTNPFFFIDHHGCPAGRVDRELVPGRNGSWTRATNYIGARLAANPDIEREGPSIGDKKAEVGKFAKAKHHVRYVFRRGDVLVEATKYTKRQVAEGALIAADEATAKLCGVKFRDPELVREEWRKRSDATTEPLWAEDEVIERVAAPVEGVGSVPDAEPDQEPEPIKQTARGPRRKNTDGPDAA